MRETLTEAITWRNGWWIPRHLNGLQKFFRRAQVIDVALASWSGPQRCVIQAGGHIGVWPGVLAAFFETVYTYEPEPSNYACLARNMAGRARVHPVRGALGATLGMVDVNVQPHSTGGHHIATRHDRPYCTVECWTIDSLGRADVDALFLDIEGYELAALHGAVQTIASSQPLIVVENNGCSRKYGVAADVLPAYLRETLGYDQVAAYGEDLVFVPRRH